MSLSIPPEIWEMILESREKDQKIKQLNDIITNLKNEFGFNSCDVCKQYKSNKKFLPNKFLPKRRIFCKHVPNKNLCTKCYGGSCSECQRRFCIRCFTQRLRAFECHDSICDGSTYRCCYNCLDQDSDLEFKCPMKNYHWSSD